MGGASSDDEIDLADLMAADGDANNDGENNAINDAKNSAESSSSSAAAAEDDEAAAAMVMFNCAIHIVLCVCL